MVGNEYAGVIYKNTCAYYYIHCGILYNISAISLTNLGEKIM